MKLHVYGDGRRDKHALRPLLEKLLEVRIDAQFKPWARLHSAKGYRKKVQYAIVSASQNGADGVVAVCDADRDDKRIAEMRQGRDQHRQKAVFPTALGQADPHGEAWLIDDPSAVRAALGLPRDCDVANVRRCDPKTEFNRLLALTQTSDQEAVPAIIGGLDLARCNHKGETGLGDFVDDVLRELGPVARRRP